MTSSVYGNERKTATGNVNITQEIFHYHIVVKVIHQQATSTWYSIYYTFTIHVLYMCYTCIICVQYTSEQ